MTVTRLTALLARASPIPSACATNRPAAERFDGNVTVVLLTVGPVVIPTLLTDAPRLLSQEAAKAALPERPVPFSTSTDSPPKSTIVGMANATWSGLSAACDAAGGALMKSLTAPAMVLPEATT